METKLISSTQNPLVKNILQLKEKSRERKKAGLCVVEGQRELNWPKKVDMLCKPFFFVQKSWVLIPLRHLQRLQVLKSSKFLKAFMAKLLIAVPQKVFLG